MEALYATGYLGRGSMHVERVFDWELVDDGRRRCGSNNPYARGI
jgi:hypothetical protein